MQSKIPARLAYIWTDGTPRVIPIWFHWNGREIVMGTPPNAPKLKALARNPKVSLTIDDNDFPHKVLLIRGTARLETVNGIVPEYAAAAERYFSHEQSAGLDGPTSHPVSTWCGSPSRRNGLGFWIFRLAFPAPYRPEILWAVGPDALVRAGEPARLGFNVCTSAAGLCPAGRVRHPPLRSASYSPSFSKNRQIDSMPR